MPDFHPTAIIRGEVELADDVLVGPGCVLDGMSGPITVGAGTRLIGNVYLYGPLKIGTANTLYPGVCIGFAPQSVGFDDSVAGPGVLIGDHNVLREGVTIHRAITDEGPTTIGHQCYFMVNAHAGHDVQVGDHCVLVNGALLGGHAVVGSWVTVGGNSTVHQFTRLGRGAFLSGSLGVARDLPPFFMATATNHVGSLNVIGMRRMNLSAQEIEDIRWVYKMFYRRRLLPAAALEQIKTRANRPIIAEYVEFMSKCRRGLCPGQQQLKRVTIPIVTEAAETPLPG